MQLASLFVTAWLLALPSAAQEECADRISLKNWRFCDGSGGCDFPDDTWQLDVDPWSPRSGAAIIEEHQVYDIQWENADPDYGVMVSWAFPPPSIANVTRPSDYYGYWLASKSCLPQRIEGLTTNRLLPLSQIPPETTISSTSHLSLQPSLTSS